MEEIEIAQRQRERKVVELVRNFLLAQLIFRQQYAKFQKGDLHFSDLVQLADDRGQSILFSLKEICHDLFRQNFSTASEKEQIFDLTIHSIFHLAMKMREDLYQLEIYAPKYSELRAKESVSPEKQNLIHQFQEIISRAETSFREGMEEIAVLIQDSFRQFKELLTEYQENGLLIRFFLEDSELLKAVLGEKAQEEFFHLLFGRDEALAYRLAGESYFQSARYTQAVQTFSQALGKKPGDENLLFKIYLSRGMDQFYAFSLKEALSSFEQCLSLADQVEILENYRAMIRKVCQKISEEFPGRRKSDQHRNLTEKAKKLQRRLDELPPAPSDVFPS